MIGAVAHPRGHLEGGKQGLAKAKLVGGTRLALLLLTIGLVLLGSLLAGVGCKPSGGEQEGPTADTGGAGGLAGGLTLVTGAPGEGLPTSLPSGLLVLAVRMSFDAPGDSFSFRDVISTLDASGQNLTRYFALSLDDLIWRLSPDGTKVATYREVYDEATGESAGSYHIYDLSAGTVTPLAMPPKVYAFGGDHGFVGRDRFFYWSEDSQTVLYTYIADRDRNIRNGLDFMVSLAIAPVDGSTAVFKDIGYGERVFAPIPGRGEIIFGGPGSDQTSSDSDIMGNSTLNVYAPGTSETRKVARIANQASTVAVSYDGRFVAYECSDDGADGTSPVYFHDDLSLLDLASGTISAVDDHTDIPTSIFDRTCWWSPVGDILAVIINDKTSDGGTVSSIYFYDPAQSRKVAETAVISKYSLLGATWSGDGKAFFATFDTTVYRVDAETGEFAPFYTSDQPKSGLAVSP